MFHNEESMFEMSAKSTAWGGEHKISLSDVRSQISQVKTPENFLPLHIVPLRYDTPNAVLPFLSLFRKY